MADLAIPTSWPLPPTSPIPPTSPTQAVTSLQRQLKALRIDIAELTAQAEAAADRTARVLQSLRSRDQVGSGTSNEPSSQETELSLTLRDHPFARFIYHDNALAHPSASASDAGQSAKTSRQGRSIALNRAETPIKGHASQVKASNTGFAPVAAPKVPLYSTYEQSRLFLQVTAAVKNEKNRSIQCDIVETRVAKLLAQITETTSVDVCWLVARQIVAYMRFLNLDRVRRFVYEQTRHFSQRCTAWWGRPSDLVEQALACCSFVQEVNDPIFDGIVALVLIHFGVFDVNAKGSKPRDRTSKDGTSSRKRFSTLLKRTRSSTPDLERATPHGRFIEGQHQKQALSVDALIAITELCLQGVFSEAMLCDILALFNLGDIDHDFSEVDTDMKLLYGFLHKGLLPRAASIRASFADADPIREVLDILGSVQKLNEAKQAQQAQQAGTASSVERMTPRPSSSSRNDETEWVPLERFPSSAVASWSQSPRSPLKKLLPRRKSVEQAVLDAEAQKPINMIDILNGQGNARK